MEAIVKRVTLTILEDIRVIIFEEEIGVGTTMAVQGFLALLFNTSPGILGSARPHIFTCYEHGNDVPTC